MAEKKIELVYFGKKNPKKVAIEHQGKTLTETFIPFQAKETDETLAKILLKNAGDIFQRLDKDQGKPVKKHQPKTDGYVGDVPADKLKKPVKEQIIEDAKEEEGKDIEQLEKETRDKAKRKKKK